MTSSKAYMLHLQQSDILNRKRHRDGGISNEGSSNGSFMDSCYLLIVRLFY